MITGENFHPEMKLSSRSHTHNMWHSSTYRSWHKIKQRCLNKKNNRYSSYGGRGIGICEKWLNFEGFYEDMGDRPMGTSIERVDNNIGYFKDNCKWANGSIQSANRRRSIKSNFPRGVSASGTRFRSFITIAYKQYHLGCFKTAEEAHSEYCKIALEWWGIIPSSDD